MITKAATLARAGLFVTTALLLHLGLADPDAPLRLVVALAGLQAGCAGALATRGWRRGGCLLPLLTCLVWPACRTVPRMGIVSTLLASHAILYLGLAALFGVTLLPGRIPLVTQMAHEVEPRLTPRMLAYTRRVTWLWALYGPVQVVASLLLLWLAPLGTWSMFVNLLDLPLLAAVFLGEFAFRSWWLRGDTHARLADGWRAARRRWPAAASPSERR